MDKPDIDHVISDAEDNDIRNDFSSTRSKLSFCKSIDSKMRRNLVKMGPKSKGFVDQVHSAVHTHPNSLSPGFDKDKFERNRVLLQQLEQYKADADSYYGPLCDTITLLRHQEMRMAYGAYAGLKVEEKVGVEPVRLTVHDLMELKKHNNFDEHNLIGNIKKNEALRIEYIKSRSRFRNIGDTVLEVFKGDNENASSQLVNPGNFLRLAKGCKTIYVKNKSADTDGKCRVKVRVEK